MDNILLVVRAVHLTATVMACGAVFFHVLVLTPALREVQTSPEWMGLTGRGQFWVRMRWIFATSVSVAVLSGAAWFFIVAAAIGDGAADDVVAGELASKVAMGTQFGRTCLLRLGLATALVFNVPMLNPPGPQPRSWQHWRAAVLAAGFAASLAWAGHAGAAPGLAGGALRLSDMLHLLAVSCWVGGLVPLALLIWAARRGGDPIRSDVVAIATGRFSNMGLAAVATIVATGLVNAWLLLGSAAALGETTYGRLLLAKIGIVLVMVGIAAINRFRLTPRLDRTRARDQLARNSLTEAALGLAAIAIAGALGTLPPLGPSHPGEHLEHMH